MVDSILVQFFVNLPPVVQAAILTFLTLSFLVSQFLSNSPTPPPNTPYGRVYAALEVFGGIYGRAKQVGIPVPPQPTVAELMKEIDALKAATAPVTAEVPPATPAGA